MSETAEWGNVCSRVDTCALTGAAAFFNGVGQKIRCYTYVPITFRLR